MKKSNLNFDEMKFS